MCAKRVDKYSPIKTRCLHFHPEECKCCQCKSHRQDASQMTHYYIHLCTQLCSVWILYSNFVIHHQSEAPPPPLLRDHSCDSRVHECPILHTLFFTLIKCIILVFKVHFLCWIFSVTTLLALFILKHVLVTDHSQKSSEESVIFWGLIYKHVFNWSHPLRGKWCFQPHFMRTPFPTQRMWSVKTNLTG